MKRARSNRGTRSASEGETLTPALSQGERGPALGRQVVIVLALCAVVFWVRLGADGLGATEGHRAVPGWEMLDTGRWLVPTMFDQPYLRKPPGMSWAVALS